MAVIDLVSWNPQGGQTIFAYRFPQNNLSTFTQLIVQESQEAVLFSKGQIIGKFGPGKHTLNTENLPILRNLYGLPFGGKNPYTAEVWFVNKLQPYNINWEINRMDIHDADYNTGIPLIAIGSYGLRIIDAERFLIKIVGTKAIFDQKDLTEQFFGEFSTKTKSTVAQFMMNNNIGIKKISAYLDNISDHLRSQMLPFWENFGFELTKFYVTSIEVDNTTEVGRRVLDAISRQSAQSIGGYTWQQEQTFGMANNAIDGFSNSNSGVLGAVIATNMMGNLGGGGMMQPQYNQPSFGGSGNAPSSAQNTASTNVPAAVREVYCSNCSKKFSANNRFCPHCGDPYDACPKCGTDNDKKAKRCVSCGTNLQSEYNTCSGCNAPMQPGSMFCSNCGKQQSEDRCVRCASPVTPNTKFCPKCGQKQP